MAEEEKVTPVAEEATSMADYEKELEAFKKIEEGDMITGTVIAVDEEEITLDLRYYTEGIIKVSDYSREPGFMVKEEVHVGDEVTATVIGRDNRRGCILLSRVEANDVLAWDKLRQLKEDKTVLNVTVKASSMQVSSHTWKESVDLSRLPNFPELCGRSERIPEQRDPGTGF